MHLNREKHNSPHSNIQDDAIAVLSAKSFRAISKIKIQGNVSDAFSNAVCATKFPCVTANFIRTYCGNIVVADYYTRAKPELADIVRTKTEDDDRNHANHWAGGFHFANKDIIVVEYVLGSDHCGLTYRLPAESATAWDKNWYPRPTLRHEIGHLIDFLLEWISESPGFRAAWLRDVERLGGEDAVREMGLGYFIQNGIKGRREVFAELWAHKHGGGMRSLSSCTIHRNFTECHTWMTEFVECFQAALQQGHKEAWSLGRDYHYEARTEKSAAIKQVQDLTQGKNLMLLRQENFYKAGLKLCGRLLSIDTPDGWEAAATLALSIQFSSQKQAAQNHCGRIYRVLRRSKLGEDKNIIQAVDDFFALKTVFHQKSLACG